MVLQFNVKTDGKFKVAPNFTVSEFACKDGSEIVLVDEELAQILQIVRNYYGRPLIINSGFRTISHNEKVGGETGSYHTLGMAADFYVRGISVANVVNLLNKICGNAYGIGTYKDYIHIDTRRECARWTK